MEGVEQMSRVDRAWLLMERPRNPMMIVGLIVVDGSVGYGRLRNLVSERLLAFDRSRCRPVSDTLGARWVPQAEFDLSDHVSRVALPGGAGIPSATTPQSRSRARPIRRCASRARAMSGLHRPSWTSEARQPPLVRCQGCRPRKASVCGHARQVLRHAGFDRCRNMCHGPVGSR
jgi:hypothetical protein